MATTKQETGLQTYTVDSSHSEMGFTVRHMGFSKVRGRFETFEGTIRMDPEDISTLDVEATIQAASITTDEEDRDTHLRSEDFFQVEEYPELTFESTGVRDVSDGKFTLVGDLTIRGVTKTVELEGEFLGEGKDPWGVSRVGFEADTTVNRKEFGLNWNKILETGNVFVSDEVDIVLDVEATHEEG